ncbi:MAG: right-handed parallel beta-helix repeat-containing protein [Candidatus Yonathbacteria bacterium]|nr:right-handed parallel beta-helix repeat-containing protein [Candidatus Yonathbacteria bacterium]
MNGTIAPHEYRVLERWLDATIVDVTAGQVYGNGGTQWALSNSGEQLNLSHASTTLDQTPLGAWVAGYNSTATRQTMERYSSRELGADPANWGTNLGYIKNGIDANGNVIEGTPGAQNSVSTLINKGQNITSDLALTNAEEHYVIATSTTVSASSTLAIASGVVVQFYNTGNWPPPELNILGTLHATGTPQNPVIFESFSEDNAGSIYFVGSAGATSTLSNVFLSNISGISIESGARVAMSDSALSNSGGIALSGGSSIAINNTHFASTTQEALALSGGSSAVLASSTIEHAGTYGYGSDAIGLYGASSLLMSSTTIRDLVRNGNGVDLYEGSRAEIADSIIENMPRDSGVSAYDSFVSIASSTIRNTVKDNGIALYNSTSTIANVVVENGKYAGIAVFDGTTTIKDSKVSGFGDAGVVISAGTIANTEIFNNTIGVDMPSVGVILQDVSLHDNGINFVVDGVPVP